MNILEPLVLLGVFAFATHRCGKCINKREWGESVADFLFALGVMLLLVKNSPSL